MYGKLLFKRKVAAHRLLWGQATWIKGWFYAFDDDLRFFPRSALNEVGGNGVLVQFRWQEVIAIRARREGLGGVLEIELPKGVQTFRCLRPFHLAEELEAVRAAFLQTLAPAADTPAAETEKGRSAGLDPRELFAG